MDPLTRILQVTAITCFILGMFALAGAAGVFNGVGQQAIRIACPELPSLLEGVEQGEHQAAVAGLVEESCGLIDQGTVTFEEFVVFQAELDLAVRDDKVSQAERLSVERVFEALREPN